MNSDRVFFSCTFAAIVLIAVFVYWVSGGAPDEQARQRTEAKAQAWLETNHIAPLKIQCGHASGHDYGVCCAAYKDDHGAILWTPLICRDNSPCEPGMDRCN